MTVLQSVASLAATTTGATIVFLVVAAMVYAIIKLAMRRLRSPYVFVGATLLAVVACRMVYFLLVGPLLIAYLLMIKTPKQETSER